MTAETPTDNSEEIQNEDNFEETGEEVTSVDGDDEQLASESDSHDEDAFWNGNPEELPDDLKSTYKSMQGAFTKRMQRLSALESKYFDSIDAANAALMSRSDQRSAPEPEQVEETPPDMANGASPDDVINYYVEQAVSKAMKETGVGRLAEEMQPVAHRERVTAAYRSFATENPNFDHQKLAPLAGQIIDNDPELAELAQTNPSAAIRLAARVARAEIKTMATKQKTKKRRQAAPVSARSGTVVQHRRESMLEAATRALKEAGVNPDAL